ncbi:hypothetical protein A2767_05495 [Candidatus Roizmanbacteria bacterium RIFCSPHIGHO2_01_FULL_35_10]|uniref:SpoVT-AbrB domain-containing protein n=1 Tax=Candidatus Roizmanbacteria bacterium RIFCSPLOWO2_01_FULL_35_13 TaxID=1802055 RepID=A0A1F7IBL1_9BACT|nr:MAG: hypothetical protein A2767_05495 [Candidatus Roizmanbacteria bacterium RIFCSPHIGHO2_01_FULL_35_10]OGK40746.1 MAG: hypothetical protein A3A74_03965 [Candidatus Roizmanbacteria bacterium RIFCSPLOWO2_01_FULL_35_13]
MLLPQIVDVSEKGQILIPVAIRKALGIRPKGKVFLYPKVEEKKMLLEPLEGNDIIESTFGMLAKDKSRGKSMTQKLLEERRRDLAGEETTFIHRDKKKK